MFETTIGGIGRQSREIGFAHSAWPQFRFSLTPEHASYSNAKPFEVFPKFR